MSCVFFSEFSLHREQQETPCDMRIGKLARKVLSGFILMSFFIRILMTNDGLLQLGRKYFLHVWTNSLGELFFFIFSKHQERTDETEAICRSKIAEKIGPSPRRPSRHVVLFHPYTNTFFMIRKISMIHSSSSWIFSKHHCLPKKHSPHKSYKP